MGDYKVNVETNTTIRNYKPVEGREVQKTDRVYSNSNGKVTLPDAYKLSFDALQALDGKEGLSWDDAVLAKSLAGTNGIKGVGLDANAKVLSFTYDDNTYISINMGVNNKPAIENLQADIADGTASYISANVLTFIDQWIGGAQRFGDEIRITYPEGTTFGDIKARYNLPDGSLADYARLSGASGNRDRCLAPKNGLTFNVKTFAESNGLTTEQVKELFK